MEITSQTQQEIDKQNQKFWAELCGTVFAQDLGLTGKDLETIKKYDQAYMDYYPYLLEMIHPEQMRGKKVLEIGLGYGTLARNLASQSESYTGLDISEGPVFMANHSFELMNIRGQAKVGSALAIPFPDQSFDFVVSIGCLH